MRTVFKENWNRSQLQLAYKQLLKNKRIKIAMDFLDEKSIVLEVGCSFGTISYYMAKEKKCLVDAYEIDEQRLKLAKENFKHKNIRYFDKDVTKIKKKNYYDCLILLEVIEHIENPYDFLKKLKVFIKKDGYLILSTPNANDYLQSVRNLKLYLKVLRKNKADFIADRNNVKFGDHDDHLYAWTWETLFRLLNRVGFKYVDSNFSDIRSISYGKFHLFNGGMPVLDLLFKPFTTNLIFKVQKQ